MNLRVPNQKPWTPEQWDRIRAAGEQYDRDIKEPWRTAQEDTRPLREAWERARTNGDRQAQDKLEQDIRNHPSILAFLAVQKTALAKRSQAFPKART